MCAGCGVQPLPEKGQKDKGRLGNHRVCVFRSVLSRFNASSASFSHGQVLDDSQLCVKDAEGLLVPTPVRTPFDQLPRDDVKKAVNR